MLVSTHGFKNELCHTCSVLVSTHGFKNELYMLHVKRASLNLWLKA